MLTDSTTWLMNGDCLELMKEIPSGSVDLVLCDLPYGTTQNKWDTVIDLEKLWEQYKRICTGAVVLTAAQPFTSSLIMSNVKDFKYQWIWEKSKATGHLNAKKQPMKAHEDICVFSANLYNPQKEAGIPYKPNGGKSKLDNYGDFAAVREGSEDGRRYPRTVIRFGHEIKPVHPTQKPVALMEYLIRTYTNEGMTVLDNCMGSGTTGVACVNTGRKFIGIEKDEAYFEIAKNRILGSAPAAQPVTIPILPAPTLTVASLFA
jgi:site-specific DNA-methyltransferase (adenine-specific)